jgi:hypothetical protein
MGWTCSKDRHGKCKEVKLSLCFNLAPRREGARGSGSIAPEGEWSTSCPSRFTSRENAPDTHWTGS